MNESGGMEMQDQDKRRKNIYQLYLEHMGDVVDETGGWHGTGKEPTFREKMWHCLPLLDTGGEMAERANMIIGNLTPNKCHFSPMTAMQMLLKYEDRLQEKIRMKLEHYVKESLGWMADERIHFTMYNDNFAAMAMFTLLTAGERFNDHSAFEAGVSKLKQLMQVFTRCGTIMEFGSPTYTPITTHVLAETVNYVHDATVNKWAIACEERMWTELAMRFHPPTSQMAGPYSRAYLIDSVGHVHLVHALLYLVFGDKVFINPKENLFPTDERQIIHCGTDTLMWPNTVWLVSASCHCPDHLSHILMNKTYPFEVSMTAECLPGSEYLYAEADETEYGAHTGPNVTFMTEDYALGTAHSQFFDGAISDSFHLVYRKNEQARTQSEIGTVFSRYIFNEQMPGQTNTYNGNEHGPEMLRDEGRKFALQHRDCALVVYKPKPYEAAKVSSMKLSVLFPMHYSKVEEVWVGDKKLSGLSGEGNESETVFIKDGPVYMAFRPLSITNLGRKSAVKVKIKGSFLEISFYNYEGPERSFDKKEILLTSSGFAVYVKQVKKIQNIQMFMDEVNGAALSDKQTNQLNGYTRWIDYQSKDLSLEFAYSPRSEGILYASVNGRPRSRERIKATGVNVAELPFLKEGD
jgi:hypothetical protein